MTMTDPATRAKRQTLPPSLPPRGLSRVEAAAYIGVSASHFDQLVKEGVMPKPVRFGTRTVWDRLKVDLAFVALEEQDGENPWEN